jgi:aerobic C4-dicarboxylate transport protein
MATSGNNASERQAGSDPEARFAKFQIGVCVTTKIVIAEVPRPSNDGSEHHRLIGGTRMISNTIQPASHRRHQPWYRVLYVQVLIAIALGILIGYFFPDLGKELKPLGDGFIALIKMMIAPVIFCTVVHGISSMGDLKRVGRVGLKTLVYFETVSTVALAVGLLVGELLQPGHGFNIDPTTIDPKSVATYVTKAKEEGIVAHLMAIIPDSYFGAIARGDLLQVLLISILSGFAIALLGRAGEPIAEAMTRPRRCFSASSASSCASLRLER